MNHTKEPWIVSSRRATFIIKPNSVYTEVIAQCYFLDNKKEEANAKRIVACVNACEGITNEALEAGYIKHLVETDKKRHEFLCSISDIKKEYTYKGKKILEDV
jgi:hypothetical protein